MSEVHVEPMSWMLGILGTITTGWVALTSKTVSQHETKIAVLEQTHREIASRQDEIKTSLSRIEDALFITKGGPSGRNA